MNNNKQGLNIEIVHESTVNELVRIHNNFLFLKNFNIPKDEVIRWDMGGKTIYCIQVMFIGKTGYGKSTTLNKICQQELFKTDDINSCTKTLFSAEYRIHKHKNYYFSLCDLPGIGESISADVTYLEYYTEMLQKSQCVIYVMRADQRDYSKDLETLKPMLESEIHKKKIMLAVNFVDKIEPLSRSSPFKPNAQQEKNIERKLSEVQRIFNIPKANIVFYSATEEYNLEKVINGITIILKYNIDISLGGRRKRKFDYHERRQAIYEMTSQDNCGECGCKNCMQFAMQAASEKNSMALSDCPYIDEDEAMEFLENEDKETDKISKPVKPKDIKFSPVWCW